MKSRIVLLLAVCMIFAVMAAPAAAKDLAGERIYLFDDDPHTYSAYEPFYIHHGFWGDPVIDNPVGIFEFTLDVDGVDQGKGKVINLGLGITGGVWVRHFLYEFPDGMEESDVTFTGHWWAPCEYAMEWYEYPGPCENPNAQVEVFTWDHTVTFS